MFKRLLFVFVLFVICSSAAYSQWTYKGMFPPGPDTLFGNTGGHGVAVDPDNKVWITPYRPFKIDSVFVPDSNKYFNVRPILVFNADGTPAPFSPIKLINTPEHKNKVIQWSKTGMTVTNRGNIIFDDYDELVEINYKTGEGMHWIGLTVSPASSLCKPAVDTLGNIYVSYTLEGDPIKILDSNFTFVANAIDTLKDIGRTTDVSKDGNTIWAHRFTANATYVYHRNSEFDKYVLVDTVLKGLTIEGSNFNPANGLLYVSSGSYNNKPLTDPGSFYPNATIGTYYGVNVNTKPYQVLDSLKWQFTKPAGPDERNRGIAFTKDGKTAYITAFGESYYPIVQKFTNDNIPGGVKKENNTVVQSYALSQNFPNPFNPSTEIKFSIVKEGFVTLKVYDMLGKEVTTLVNEKLSSGNYSASFNASSYSSGMYVYQLVTNGVVLSRKMTLLK